MFLSSWHGDHMSGLLISLLFSHWCSEFRILTQLLKSPWWWWLTGFKMFASESWTASSGDWNGITHSAFKSLWLRMFPVKGASTCLSAQHYTAALPTSWPRLRVGTRAHKTCAPLPRMDCGYRIVSSLEKGHGSQQGWYNLDPRASSEIPGWNLQQLRWLAAW